MRNIEYKSRLRDRAAVETRCKEIGAVCEGDLRQTDTYFPVNEGRLKLREQDPGDDYIVFYRRPDEASPKASHYAIEFVDRAVKPQLTEALGILAVVDKTRTLYMWHNVRIHLDRVDALGDFIEFEAVLDAEHDADDGYAKLDELCGRFGLHPGDAVAGSYLDLIRDRDRKE